MTNRLFSVLAASSLIILLGGERAAAQQPKCRPADHTTENIITDLKRWITTTDPERISARDSVFKIPVVSVSQISVVTDERVCSKIIQGYVAMEGGYAPVSVYVIKMGTKYYAAHDPLRKAGEHSTVHIFDSKYKSYGGWTGG